MLYLLASRGCCVLTELNFASNGSKTNETCDAIAFTSSHIFYANINDLTASVSQIWTLYQILASVTNYNNVFTNAEISYVAQKGKYVDPNIGPSYSTLEACLSKTVYPNIVACYVMFSPSKQQCSLYLTSTCDDYVMKLLQNKVHEDTTVYMRVTYTSSSTADPTSKSPSPTVSNSVSSSVATVTSSVASSTATISSTAASTFTTQSTLMHSTPSDPTSTHTLASNPTVDYTTPTPSEEVSDSIFISTPVTTYQEIITTSLETSDSTQPFTTEQISDSPEVIPSFSTTPSVSNTTSEEVSSNITAGSSGFNNSVPTSSESPNKKLCPCKCRRRSPLTEEELESTIVSLRKELSVNKSTLSRTIRSKTSAPDNRTSATSMGMAGIVILVSCVVFLVASDFSHLCQHAKILKQNLMSRFK
ncbi:unnamed protein product [Acanthosepion pharaonis]|uniref:Uncharacterized protein n=1 Tax=Acanthosepion pharaonis TaxID=158019 RepID=A0A812BWF7_ACAPH|nr:unnamed protein product [Sepia pharaonis]